MTNYKVYSANGTLLGYVKAYYYYDACRKALLQFETSKIREVK